MLHEGGATGIEKKLKWVKNEVFVPHFYVDEEETTWRNFPHYSILHCPRHENLNSHIFLRDSTKNRTMSYVRNFRSTICY